MFMLFTCQISYIACKTLQKAYGTPEETDCIRQQNDSKLYLD